MIGTLWLVIALIIAVPLSTLRASMPGSPRPPAFESPRQTINGADVRVQLDNAIIKPRVPLRGKVAVSTTYGTDIPSGKPLVLRVALLAVPGSWYDGSRPSNWNPFSTLAFSSGQAGTGWGSFPSDIRDLVRSTAEGAFIQVRVEFESKVGLRSFDLAQMAGLASPAKPATYLCLATLHPKDDLTNLSIYGGGWATFEVNENPRAIELEKVDLDPNPPTRKKMSVLTLEFAVPGLENKPEGPGEVVADVFLMRYDTGNFKYNPWRIGTRKFNYLKPVNGVARATLRVRLTPQEARHYRLNYKVSCDGYEPLVGTVPYTVLDDGSGPSTPVPSGEIEWVYTGKPVIETREWPNKIPGDPHYVPDYTLTITETGLDSLSTRDNKNKHSQLSWSTPPRVIRNGQVVRLETKTVANSEVAIGARWYALCEHKDDFGETFLATFEPKGSIVYTTTVVLPRTPPSEKESKTPVRFFRVNAGPWNSSGGADVWWEYLPRQAKPGLTQAELDGLPVNQAGASVDELQSGATGGNTGAGTPPPAGSGASGQGNTPPPNPPTTPPKPVTGIFTGTYNTTYGDWGVITLKQEGNKVTGTWGGSIYGGPPTGTLTGTAEGRVVRLKWMTNDQKLWGGCMFTLSEDGQLLKGHRNDWREPEFKQYTWDAKRTGG